MKKLKIFLLLSILLCLGFALNTEVHALGDGPKAFEGGDILPATTHLKISWDNTFDFTDYVESWINLYGYPSIFIGYDEYYDEYSFEISMSTYSIFIVSESLWCQPYSEYGGSGLSYVVIDISQLSEEQRTIDPDSATITGLYWEDLNTSTVPSGPKIFEEEDILPAGYIKISWNFTGYPMAVDGDFLISSDGDFSIRIWEFGDITLFINDEMFYADTPGNTIITLTESVTITDMDGYDDYYEYIHGALFWEVISQDYLDGFMEARELYGFDIGGYWVSGEQAWNNGYDLGSELAWEEGFEYGMDIYGYYDPITDQWLSVSEYLSLYGTDKPGQSDFYNNFDKYFIPAMIIVFGGAIVLTILKVFKGRE